MAIHLSGSVAYDRIMTFPGRFEDHLLPDKLHILNVSFLLDRLEEKRGGTAGNIAYNLALLGEKPLLYSSVGKDFAPYALALAKFDLCLDQVRIVENDFTASAYITTDQKSNQITGFNPGAMRTPCDPEHSPRPQPGDWAVVAPGNPEDMRALPALYRATNTPFIFDPGQQVTNLDAFTLCQSLDNAQVLIGNDYEIELIKQKCQIDQDYLLDHVRYLITTLGDQGSEIKSRCLDAPIKIGIAAIEQLADPTGAGDAYRAGLIKGLCANLDIAQAARLGAVCSSFCVEQYGTQEHNFSHEQFAGRYQNAFGANLPLLW